MDGILLTLKAWFSPERLLSFGGALVILVVGVVVARVVARVLGTTARARFGQQNGLIVQRITFYGLAGVVVMLTLHQLGFDPSVLLGAAGILTVALGFASQTSASNLISGLFLLGERPFVIGDYIRMGAAADAPAGEVVSIDLLSVKIRTYDNLLLRIPNETLLKSTLTTITHYPLRRIDTFFGVAYKEDVGHVRELLEQIADRNPLVMASPEPMFIFRGFGDSSLDIQWSVWATQESFHELRNTIRMELKRTLDEAGVEIPFPHRTLYAGSVTEAFPVRVADAVGHTETPPER
jgi:small-conductance mechanosensitive channel